MPACFQGVDMYLYHTAPSTHCAPESPAPSCPPLPQRWTEYQEHFCNCAHSASVFFVFLDQSSLWGQKKAALGHWRRFFLPPTPHPTQDQPLDLITGRRVKSETKVTSRAVLLVADCPSLEVQGQQSTELWAKPGCVPGSSSPPPHLNLSL